MISFPAVCDRCGASYIDAFGGTLEGRISLAGQSRPGCPGCGGNISLPNGRYGFAGHVIRLVSHPGISEADLKKLDLLLADLEQGTLSLAECMDTIETGHAKFQFLASICAWYAQSPEQSVRILAGLFRDMIAAVQAYLPVRATNFEQFEHAANEHFILSWDTKSEDKKTDLERLVLAPVDDARKKTGRVKMGKLKQARKRLKRRSS